jgi:hypothetical protein
MVLERRHQGEGEHGDSILGSLPVSYQNLVKAEVDVFDPQPQTLQQAHAGAIEQGEQEVLDAFQPCEHAPDFVLGQDDRQLPLPLGSYQAFELAEASFEDFPVQEEQRA